MKLTLCIFIDAFGWEILQEHPNFLRGLIKDQKKLKTLLGYSSACDPSIISGLTPTQHLHWSSFYYSPETCPYKWTQLLGWLPQSITKYQRVRNKISQFIKKVHSFSGYFQIYQFPFKYLHYFDYAEKMRIWNENGLWRGKTIFNHLIENNIPYYVGDQEPSDEEQLYKAAELIQNQSISYAYLLMGKLDGLMHALGTHHPQVDQLIEWYDQHIRKLIQIAEENYDSVSWYIFSDHGMHNVTETLDLQKEINQLDLQYGKDYVAVYDSTMGRFWYFNDKSRKKITSCLEQITKGKILTPQQLQEHGAYFPDNLYGETIFLVDPGVLIIPSFMGLKPIPGMHGYDPEDADSYPMICGNHKLPKNLTRIEEIYDLMMQDVGLQRNIVEHQITSE